MLLVPKSLEPFTSTSVVIVRVASVGGSGTLGGTSQRSERIGFWNRRGGSGRRAGNSRNAVVIAHVRSGGGDAWAFQGVGWIMNY